jgi:Protein of unknown function (DUF3054)
VNRSLLVIGDILALAITTLSGFIAHGEAELSFLSRFAAIYFPLSISWFLLAPWFGLFQPEITSNPKRLWRVPLTMLFAAPLAVTMRSALLATDVLPIFVLVFGVTSAFGLMLWRGLYFLFQRKS